MDSYYAIQRVGDELSELNKNMTEFLFAYTEAHGIGIQEPEAQPLTQWEVDVAAGVYDEVKPEPTSVWTLDEGNKAWEPDVLSDSVSHPSHYTHYHGIEVIQLTEQMNFNRGNAVKYIARAGLKSVETEIEDLNKAKQYLEFEIARVLREKERKTNAS